MTGYSVERKAVEFEGGKWEEVALGDGKGGGRAYLASRPRGYVPYLSQKKKKWKEGRHTLWKKVKYF